MIGEGIDAKGLGGRNDVAANHGHHGDAGGDDNNEENEDNDDENDVF